MSKIKKMLLFTLAGAAFWINASAALAASSWGSPYQIVRFGTDVRLNFSWGIDLNGPPANNRLTCSTSQCWFGPIPRTGLGPSGSQDCDSGGFCQGASAGIAQSMIQVPNNITYDEAYNLYVAAKKKTSDSIQVSGGATNSIWLTPATKWGALCVGFAVLPVGRGAVSTLAQNSTCGVITPMNLTCTTTVPSTLDFGQINVGESATKTAQGSGSVTCDRSATMRVAIIGAQPSIAGKPIQISINGTQVTNQAGPTGTVIGKGSNVNLDIKATVNGPFNTAGRFTSSTTLLFSYN
ncbi:hypothetical protein [Providencia sp. Me31A]|uniref:hypothetical protein n=1 Tax=Providencia sp. Me31A TaxID=3392637 RepID=UPI003D2DA260